jgi:phosphoglycolate phosphatase-like HAD superfamily hydrolase
MQKFDAIICDWNGTLIANRDDRPIMECIARGLFKASIPLHPLRIYRILDTRNKLLSIYREAKKDGDFDFVREMYRIFNRTVIDGVSASFIRKQVKLYAISQETTDKLDYRVLGTVETFHEKGKTTGILSAGYQYAIESTLQAAGFHELFDFYFADTLREKDGKALGFELTIYGNKRHSLIKLLKEKGLKEDKLVYIGDSEDDLGCFEIAGFPIVAFMASDEIKEKCAKQYQAFVPDDEEDLLNYLHQL